MGKGLGIAIAGGGNPLKQTPFFSLLLRRRKPLPSRHRLSNLPFSPRPPSLKLLCVFSNFRFVFILPRFWLLIITIVLCQGLTVSDFFAQFWSFIISDEDNIASPLSSPFGLLPICQPVATHHNVISSNLNFFCRRRHSFNQDDSNRKPELQLLMPC